MGSLLFPAPQVRYEELKRDRFYEKIPVSMRRVICDRAWETGVWAARTQTADGEKKDIRRMIEKQKLRIEQVEKDQVIGGLCFFGEYIEKQNKICLYRLSVCRLAESQGISAAQAEELVLAHEYFHFLECTCLGQTSEQYTVPYLRIGRFCLGKTGIWALSEIGAHGFAYTYWRQRYGTENQ